MAERKYRTNLVKEAVLHHLVDAKIDFMTEFVGVGPEDTDLDVEGTRLGVVVGEHLTIGATGHVAYLEGALEAHGIAEVDTMVVVGVKQLQLSPFLFDGHLLEAAAEFGRRIGHGGDPLTQGIDIESAAANSNDGVMSFREEFIDYDHGIALIVRYIVGFRNGTTGNKMMCGCSKLLLRRTCHTDAKFAIELARIARENFGTHLTGQTNGLGSLARGRGAGEDEELFQNEKS